MLLRLRRPRAAHGVQGRWAEGCLTIREDQSVGEAVTLMSAHEVGSLLVLAPQSDAPATVTGILTERSYSRHVILEGRDSDTTKVGDIMKRDVVCVNVDEKLATVASVLSAHGIRHLPVLEGASLGGGDHVLRLHTEASRLRGVLSVKDVAWMLFCLVRNELKGRGIGQITVRDLMPERHTRLGVPFTIPEHWSVLSAIRMMADTNQHALVAVNQDGELTGIISERDYVYKVKVEGRHSDDTTVAQVMTQTPWCASIDFTLDDVLTIITTYGFRHLPVVGGLGGLRDGPPSLRPRPIGLVSVNDILRVITAWPSPSNRWPEGTLTGAA